MKKHLAKLAVVAVALVGVLSAQSEAAVAVAHHQHGAKVHRVVKDKHHHKKVKVRRDKHARVCHHHHKHGVRCFFFGCDANRRFRHH